MKSEKEVMKRYEFEKGMHDKHGGNDMPMIAFLQALLWVLDIDDCPPTDCGECSMYDNCGIDHDFTACGFLDNENGQTAKEQERSSRKE